MNIKDWLLLIGALVGLFGGVWLVIGKIIDRRGSSDTRKLPSYEALDNAVTELREQLTASDKARAEEVAVLRRDVENLSQARRDDKDAVRMLLYGIAQQWVGDPPTLDQAALEQLGIYVVPLPWRPKPLVS